jgi:hypothetical protein
LNGVVRAGFDDFDQLLVVAIHAAQSTASRKRNSGVARIG